MKRRRALTCSGGCPLHGGTPKKLKNKEPLDSDSKPVIVNLKGSNTWAVVTLNSSKLPVYHLVDMNQAGYGPIGNVGEVIANNQAMTSYTTSPAPAHGYHFTGVENHITGNSIVYSSRYTPDPLDNTKGTTEIVSYDFGSSTLTPQAKLIYSTYGCGSTETGQLQISPGGDQLAWYQHDQNLAGFNIRQGSLHLVKLDNLKTGMAAAPATVQPISQAGNSGNGMLEFLKNNSGMDYAQRGVYKEGPGATKYDRNVWQYDPVNLTTLAINPNLANPTINYLLGEIKRGRDGNYYIPNMGRKMDKIHSYTGSAWNGNVAVTDTAYVMAASLPTQVYKIFDESLNAPTEFIRTVGNKQYELKDHLGNVKAVISDVKLIVDSDANNTVSGSDNFVPEVLNYQDYYAFGAPMPGLKYQSGGSYRYGFNGKENDGETGTQDYGLRIYDPRVARFLSVDPLASDYPYKTPYDFAENDVIRAIDLDGGEKNVVVGVFSSYMTIKNPQGTGNVLQKRPVPIFKTSQANKFDWDNAKRVVTALGLPPNGSAYIRKNDNGATTMQYWYHDDKGVQQNITVQNLYGFLDNLDAKTQNLEKTIANGVNEVVSFYVITEPIFMPEGEAGVNTTSKHGFLPAISKMPRIIIVDQNLSPSLVGKLSNAGFTAIRFADGTLDSEIIDYMNLTKEHGADISIMTNNVKDFLKKDLSVIKVSENLKKNTDKTVDKMLKLKKNINEGKTDINAKNGVSLTNQ